MKNTISISSVAMVLAMASVSFAQTPASSAKPAPVDRTKIDFATVDKNRDGNLTKEEVTSVADLQSAFEMLDVDRDQAISRTEFASWSRAGKAVTVPARDPATAPGGSAGAQHMPDTN